MSRQKDIGDAILFEWPGEKPIERTVKQFTCDLLASVALDYKSLLDFCEDPSRNDYAKRLASGVGVRVDWRIQSIVKTAAGERSPKIIHVTVRPESRGFHFSARMEFRPYLELVKDTQRNCVSCQPARFLIQGGSGDMEACFRWLTLWKLYR